MKKKNNPAFHAFPMHLLSVQSRIRIAMVQVAALFTGRQCYFFVTRNISAVAIGYQTRYFEDGLQNC